MIITYFAVISVLIVVAVFAGHSKFYLFCELMARRQGLVVKTEDSQPRGNGIESQYTKWNISKTKLPQLSIQLSYSYYTYSLIIYL